MYAMTPSRALLLLIISLLFLAPLLNPLLELLRTPHALQAWLEADRLLELLSNTALLALVATSIAVPLGTLLGVFLARGFCIGSTFAKLLLACVLFMPLPVLAVAWQIVLGNWLAPIRSGPGSVAWQPWNLGLLPAGIVHGFAALPWVVWIVSAVLQNTDEQLEEEATLLGGSRMNFRFVLLPRLTWAVLAACAWVCVQTATEIPITDSMMVRTFAEEVYTQLIIGGAGLAQAVAITVPVWLVALLVATLIANRIPKHLGSSTQEVRLMGRKVPGLRWRIFGTLVTYCVVFVVGILPLLALVWRAAGGTISKNASAVTLIQELEKVALTRGSILLSSLAAALVCGAITAILALLACRAANRVRWLRLSLFALCLILFLTPGPLIGMGLKSFIMNLLDAEDAVLNHLGIAPVFPPLRSALFDQPSPIPGIWAGMLRFFPLAVLILAPAIRAIPRELYDETRLLGRGFGIEWKLLLSPLVGTAFWRAMLAVAVLALGEVSATKQVNPPFYNSYILRLFDQMHYGPESSVAALCLLQVFTTIVLSILMFKMAPFFHFNEVPK